jgi:hypothetical protein
MMQEILKPLLESDVLTDEVKNASLIFNKRFFSCINDKVETITFNIFDNFMLVKEENSNLTKINL